MAKYNFIYCKKCEDFYLNWSTNFNDIPTKHCPKPTCFSGNIIEFGVDSFQEMAQIEREYKIKKITNK